MIYLAIGIAVFVSIVALVLFLFFRLGKIFYHVTFDRRKNDDTFAKDENPEDKKKPSRVWFSKQDVEEVEILSKDKLNLKGYILNNKSDKLAIILHGYRGRYYSSTTQAQILFEHGYDILLPNNRAHDTSEGKTFSMGPKEVDDVLRWIDFMLKRNPNYQIVLMGMSMGGHITMMTASNEKLPENVKCFIEDCGFASLKDQLFHQIKYRLKIHYPKLVIFAGNTYCSLFHRFSLRNDASKTLKNCHIPGLFIHGDKDDYVPVENIDINYNALPERVYKEKVVFKNCAHNQANLQLDQYRKTVISFVDRFIK